MNDFIYIDDIHLVINSTGVIFETLYGYESYRYKYTRNTEIEITNSHHDYSCPNNDYDDLPPNYSFHPETR